MFLTVYQKKNTKSICDCLKINSNSLQLHTAFVDGNLFATAFLMPAADKIEAETGAHEGQQLFLRLVQTCHGEARAQDVGEKYPVGVFSGFEYENVQANFFYLGGCDTLENIKIEQHHLTKTKIKDIIVKN